MQYSALDASIKATPKLGEAAKPRLVNKGTVEDGNEAGCEEEVSGCQKRVGGVEVGDDVQPIEGHFCFNAVQ